MEKCHGTFIVPLEVGGQAAVWDKREHLFTVESQNLLALVYGSCFRSFSEIRGAGRFRSYAKMYLKGACHGCEGLKRLIDL
jgi:hypothetical protein